MSRKRPNSPIVGTVSVHKWKPATEIVQEFDRVLQDMLTPEQSTRAGRAQKEKFSQLPAHDYGFQPRKVNG